VLCVDEKTEHQNAASLGARRKPSVSESNGDLNERRTLMKTLRIAATISGLLVLVSLAVGQR
jgi:hypothetical protein